MERVSQPAVIRHWLRLELEDHGTESLDIDGLEDPEVLDQLLQLKPGAAAFIWRDAPVDWFRLDLSRREFLDLHVVAGPEHLAWRSLSPDNTIRSAGKRLARNDTATLADTTGIDVPKILALRDEMPEAAGKPLVLSTRRGCVPRTVADGNHRAVAKALYLLGGGTYEPQAAYLGAGVNPVAAPLRERICGRIRRLIYRSSDPSIQP